MDKNTQLPAEVAEKIKQEGQEMMVYAPDNKYSYIKGATAYATKLQEVQQENDQLKKKLSEWELEAYEVQGQMESLEKSAIRQNEAFQRLAEEHDRLKARRNHLTPGAPTTTGTYFAVLKQFTGDGDEMVVIHHQADKGVYYAYGVMSRPVKAEEIIGHVAREGHGMGGTSSKWTKAALTWAKETLNFAWDYVKVPESLVETWGNIYMNTMHAIQQAQQEIEQLAAGSEEDAVALLRWLNENDWSGVGSGEYINSTTGRVLKEVKLYDEFKKREK